MARERLPIAIDAQAVTDVGIESLNSAFPNLELPAASLLAALMNAIGEMFAFAAESAGLGELDDTIAERLGTSIFSEPRLEALAATADSTWTVDHTNGFTIDEGTEITLAGPGERVGFAVLETVEISPGQTQTAAGEVQLVAVVAGADGNGLQNDARPEANLPEVSAITLVAPTSGGRDQETIDAFLERFRELARLYSPSPIMAENAAALVRARIAGIDRCLPLDGYNPSNQTFNNEDMSAIAPITETGATPSQAIRDAAQDLLEETRLINFAWHVITPTRTDIAIAFAAKAHPGYDAPTVHAAAITAIAEWLSPANWGLPPNGDRREWRNEPTVRYRDLVAVVESVEGLHYTTSLTLNGGTADVALPGAAPLPNLTGIGGAGVTAP